MDLRDLTFFLGVRNCITESFIALIRHVLSPFLWKTLANKLISSGDPLPTGPRNNGNLFSSSHPGPAANRRVHLLTFSVFPSRGTIPRKTTKFL
jgi:hypothetical protein